MMQLKNGDLVELLDKTVAVVTNVWKFEKIGILVAIMVNGDVKVVPIEEILRVVN